MESFKSRRDGRGKIIQILSKMSLSLHDFFPTALTLLGVSIVTNITPNLFTMLTTQNTTENNSIILHAQNTTELQDKVLLN